jgi:hypothetical protein
MVAWPLPATKYTSSTGYSQVARYAIHIQNFSEDLMSSPSFLIYIAQTGSTVLRVRGRDRSLVPDSLPLLELIQLAQSVKATNPRDKVYGLLALLPKAIAARIHPTYSPDIPLLYTYMDFSRACLLEDVLNSLARTTINPSRESSMLSWVFDLFAEYGIPTLTMGKGHNASANAKASPTFFRGLLTHVLRRSVC